LAVEIQAAVTGTSNGFEVARKTFYMSRWIRHGGWWPNYVMRLARKDSSRWSEPHLHEQLQVKGAVGKLRAPLHHYTFSSIEDQVLANLRYSRYGSRDLENRGQSPSFFKLILKPVGKFIETYFLKKGFLDGLAGFIISVNAAHSMFLKHAYLFEKRLSRP
jgi:hypothetical protein